MNNENKIKRDLDAIWEIIATCTYYTSNLEVFNGIDDRKKELFSSYPYLLRSLNSMWALTIIDLCKLLSQSQNEAYRLRALINRLLNNHKNIDWRNPISKNQLKDLLNKIDREDKNIKEIKDQRDKRIAHSERDLTNFFVSLKKTKPLLSLCQEIYNKLSFSIAGSTTCWRYSDYDLISPVIESLVKYQEIEELTFQNLKKHQNKTDTDEILKIIRANS